MTVAYGGKIDDDGKGAVDVAKITVNESSIYVEEAGKRAEEAWITVKGGCK